MCPLEVSLMKPTGESMSWAKKSNSSRKHCRKSKEVGPPTGRFKAEWGRAQAPSRLLKSSSDTRLKDKPRGRRRSRQATSRIIKETAQRGRSQPGGEGVQGTRFQASCNG